MQKAIQGQLLTLPTYILYKRIIIYRLIPNIIPGKILPIDQDIAEYVAGIKDTLDARETVLSKEIVLDAARSGARTLWNHKEGKQDRQGRHHATGRKHRCSGCQVHPIRNRNQDIINPIGPVSPQWIRNADKLKTSTNGPFVEDRGPKPIFSKVLGCKFAPVFSVSVNSRCGMNFRSNAVFILNPSFIDLGIASINRTYKLESFSVTTT